MKKNSIIDTMVSVVEYLIGAFMMLVGVLTTVSPLTPVNGALGFIYSTRPSLVFFGTVFAICGIILLVAKIRKSKKWHGRGLIYIYLCFVFALVLNAIALGDWLGNAIGAAVMAVLYLRWRLKTAYLDPKEFQKDIEELRNDRT